MLCVGQKLGTVHSLCIDKQAWIQEELRGSMGPDVDEEEVCNSQESVKFSTGVRFPKRKRVKGSLSRTVSR